MALRAMGRKAAADWRKVTLDVRVKCRSHRSTNHNKDKIQIRSSMYPWFRFLKELIKQSRAPKIGALDPHESHHICWPWDLDPWIELNNGRTLTLYDLGRMPMALRNGLAKVAREKKWNFAVAGASVRYRKRVKMFDKITMRSQVLGWDHRFVYMEQSMWVRGECTSQALLRSAVSQGSRGIVPPAELVAAMGMPSQSPALPEWVSAWIEADATRPWPPSNAPS